MIVEPEPLAIVVYRIEEEADTERRMISFEDARSLGRDLWTRYSASTRSLVFRRVTRPKNYPDHGLGRFKPYPIRGTRFGEIQFSEPEIPLRVVLHEIAHALDRRDPANVGLALDPVRHGFSWRSYFCLLEEELYPIGLAKAFQQARLDVMPIADRWIDGRVFPFEESPSLYVRRDGS